MIPSSNVSYSLTATGAITRTVQDKLGEFVSVKDFGAVGDGVTNDTAAFQAACDYAHTVGADVLIPVAKYLLDPIIARWGVCLRGATRGPFDSVNPTTAPLQGATLLVNSDGAPFITLDGYGSSVKDIIIYYPNQVTPSASIPTVYPFAILAGASGSGLTQGPGHFIEGITIVNAYNGISLQRGSSAIRNCYIGAFNIGCYIDQIFDYTIVENVIHQVLWDTWASVKWPQPIDQWVMDHSVAFVIGRWDGFIINNIGIFARGQGFQLADSANTGLGVRAAYGTAVNIDIDFCTYGVVCSSSNPSVSAKFMNTVIGPAFSSPNVTASGIAAVLAQTGGTSPPNVKWWGGAARGTWSSPSGPVAINAGNVQCRYVGNVNETGAVAPGPAVPASGAVYTLTGATPRMVTISGGTVTQIALSGVNTGLTFGTFTLIPGETITITYSTAPVWKWFVR